jgi:hypothetical protein
MYKEFQRDDFDKFDAKAREKAKKFWFRNGFYCTDNEDEYGVDLICSKGDRTFYCEVEVKRPWHGIKFKYDTLHIPVRKGKFLSKPTQFMVFNNSMTHAAIVNRQAVLSAPCVEVPNVKIRFGEKFFDVPKDKLIFVSTI